MPLTHEAIQALPNWRTATNLRDLLMDSGVLPHIDRQLLPFERWLAERIAATGDVDHARVLQRFATWHQLRRLRAKAAKSSLGVSTTQECRQQITQAGAFLVRLAARHVTPDACAQTDLDAWYAEKYATRRTAQAFLRWCMDSSRMPRLSIPNRPTSNLRPMSQHQWVATCYPHRHRRRSPLEALRPRRPPMTARLENRHATGPEQCQPSWVTSTETTSIRVAAARNNADWCASVCRSHGIPNTFGETAWRSARRTPPYYPEAVTLHPDAVPTDFLSEIDTASPGCSVKDSFAALDLTSHGFVELFAAQWIHRPAGLATPATPTLRTEQVSTAAHLRDWQAAWHSGVETPDVFRPALLDDPSVLVLALHDGEDLCGGAVLNHSSGLVGISNLFTVDSSEAAAAWSSAITAAANHFPGLPLVGYEHGDDLAHALASGFAALGPLRIWLHRS